MTNTKVYVSGHRGMVGSTIVCELNKNKEIEIITKDRAKLDLTNQADVQNFFKKEKIDQIYLAAAKVGGIHANNVFPAEFIYENLMIQTNIIHAAFLSGIKKILFLGSSCIYPKNAKQPMKEEELLSDKLEMTNEPYAIAKIAGIKLCESYNRQYGKDLGIDYRCIMPTNLYAPGDNYDLEAGHVIPALIHRFHLAKINAEPNVIIWGSGTPKREFLFVDDLAKACIHVMNIKKNIFEQKVSSMCSHINAGSGKEISIKELAELIKAVVGYRGKINLDPSKPDGTMRKLMDSQLLNDLGWQAKFNLKEGLVIAYEAFLKT